MNPWYPLRFRPLFRRYLWGGRRLHSLLGKTIGEEDDYAESWEVVDRGVDQSVVVNGSLAGSTLHELVARHGSEVLGRHAPQARFPLLFKFLDCHRSLSVQVHPDDVQAARLDAPDLGKTEAWVVLHADPGSLVYAGLKEGVDRETLARCVAAGRTTDCLHSFEPRVGDCIFIPAGTVHALGAGLVVAEVQQASDTTFRLYDWDRVGPDGRPRPLHVRQALDVIDYRTGPVWPQPRPQPEMANRAPAIPRDLPHVPGVSPESAATSFSLPAERLVECDKFVLERREFDTSQRLGDGDRFHLIAVLEGCFTVVDHAFGRGDVVLLPAAADSLCCQPMERAVVLDIFLP
ncbi:MAG: class I mannose-6-phosphate isomerase [Pirellulaceae bacterium]|nr:class I mannose-6-phosphate isomerase [Pirellulaceae bacterium]